MAGKHRCWMAGGKKRNGGDCDAITPIGQRCYLHGEKALDRLSSIKGELLSLLDGTTSLASAVRTHGGVSYRTVARWMDNDEEFAESVRSSLRSTKRYAAELAIDTMLTRMEINDASPAELIFCAKNHPDVPFTDKHEFHTTSVEEKRLVIEQRHHILADPEVRRALEAASDRLSIDADVTGSAGLDAD